MNEDTSLSVIELATEITVAWLANPNNRVAAEDVPTFLRTMHAIGRREPPLVLGLYGQSVQARSAHPVDNIAQSAADLARASRSRAE